MRDLYPRNYAPYEDSRFGVEFTEFTKWLRKLGYSRHSIRGHIRRLKQVIEDDECFQPSGGFRDAYLQEAFAITSPKAHMYQATRRAFERFLITAGRLVSTAPMSTNEVLLRRYAQYLTEVRGFTTATLRHHRTTLQDLLSRGLSVGAELAELTTADVENYVQLKSKEISRQSLQHVVGHLRAFLRYCGDHGQTERGLDRIDTPRTYRGEQPPRALDWNLVRRLLISVDRKGRTGWRDYAILHLMAYYGLRPSEIASLHLGSVDWDAQTIRVEQSKTQSVLVLPLAPRTLRMLRRYVIAGRPTCDKPQLFLRALSPIAALNRCRIGNIFIKRAQESGLPLQGASSYALRHSFAMRLLRRGVGVKAIGDLLGHHSLESTCVYLRMDMDMLRTVALPVPSSAVV